MLTSRHVLSVLGMLALFVSAWSLPGSAGITGTALDQSYPLVVEHAASQHAQFGRDLVYTLGPLGYLYPSSQGLGGFVWQRTAFACLQAAFAAFVCMRLLAGTWLPLRVLLWLWFVLYPPLHPLLCAAGALLLMDRHGPPPRWQAWLLPALAGWMAMVKFTDLIAGALMVGAVALSAAFRRETWPVLRPLLIFGGTGLAAWICAGQSLQNLPSYLRYSWEVATGFAAMTFSPQPGALALGAAGLVLLLGGALAALRWSPARSHTVLCLLPILGCAFLSWKHGFVRADDHIIFFFGVLAGYSQLIAIAGEGVRHLQAAFTALALIIASAGAWIAGQPVHLVLLNWPESIAQKVRSRVVPIEKTSAELLAHAHLPQIQKMVGDAPVDLWGHQQAYAFLNGLNLHPRPVFQSFCAYTPVLQDLNRTFYQSSARPRYVLFQPESLDRRWPWLDDAPLALDLLTGWSPLLREKGFILMEPSARPGGEWKELASGEAKWNRKIKLPDHSAGALVAMEVECQRSPWGKAKRFLYQGSHLSIRVWLSNGVITNRSFIPEMARRHVLLSPALESTDDVLAWQTGLLPPPQVTQFTLEPWPGADREFVRTYRYRLWLWSPAPSDDRAALAARLRSQMYPYLPALPESMKPALMPALINGMEVGQSRAPCAIEMKVPDNALGLIGKVAIRRADDAVPEVVTLRSVLIDAVNHELAAREHRLSDPAQGIVDLAMSFPPAASIPGTVHRLRLEASSSLSKNRALVAWGPLRWQLMAEP